MEPATPEEDMQMPYFYIKGGSFFALFRLEEGKVVAELLPEINIQNELKSSKSPSDIILCRKHLAFDPDNLLR
jgi:hypothetical protein